MIKAVLSPFTYWRELWRGILDGAGWLCSGEALVVLRPAWMAMEVALLLIGLLFWSTLMMGVSAFSPETYGQWAVQFPALGWAAAQITGSLLIVYGLMRPITHWPAMVGSLVHVIQYQALALSAILTGGQVVIGIYPSVFFVPAHLVLAVEAWRYGRGKR